MQLVATNNALGDLALFLVIGFGVVCILIGVSISAIILKLACLTAGVDVPDTGRAMVVSFLETLIGALTYLAAAATVWLVGNATGASPALLWILSLFAVIGVAFVVPAGLYVPMLRVTFSRGLAIAVLRYVITVAILAVIAYLIFAFSESARVH